MARFVIDYLLPPPQKKNLIHVNNKGLTNTHPSGWRTQIPLTVSIVCQVHLPDPNAKERLVCALESSFCYSLTHLIVGRRRLALAAAKRADKAGTISKLRFVEVYHIVFAFSID